MLLTPEHWGAARGRWRRLALSILAGTLMAGGHAPVELPWLFFLAVPVLYWLIAVAPTGSAAFWIGWGAGFGYFAAGLHWIVHPFLVRGEGQEPLFALLWLSGGFVGLFVMAMGLAAFWGLAFWAAKRVWPGAGLVGVLCLAAMWSAVEYARTNVLTGFPWALLGYVWVETPVMQAVSWAGPFGVTLLTLILTALPLTALTARRWTLAATGLAAMALLWMAGAARLPDKIAFAADAPVIRLVQPNAPQAQKWVRGHREVFYQRALDATSAPPDPDLGPADVVIWPETAIYFLPVEHPEEVARISDSASNAPVVLGALHRETANGADLWRNSLFVIGRNRALSQRYDKHHLVPFGEYIPLSGFFDLFGVTQFAQSGQFQSGPGPTTITIPGLPAFAALICYEAIFPQGVVSAGPRPSWMVQITNDAWFGSFAGPQQHLDQARIRAIEQGLPVVRAANTGISAVIDPHGLIVASSSLNNYGGVDAKLPSSLGPTLYSRLGDLPALFLIVFSILFCGYRRNIAKRR